MNDKSKNSQSANKPLLDSDERKKAQSDDEQWLEALVTQHLDANVENLDFNVSSKLSAARHRALASAEEANRFSGSRITQWWSWPSLFASSAVLALAIFTGIQLFPSADESTSNLTAQSTQSKLMEDLTLLSASDEIEFYQSMEFLEWMEHNSG